MADIGGDSRGVHDVVQMENGDQRVHLHQHGERLSYAACCSEYGYSETGGAALGAAIQAADTGSVLHVEIWRVEMTGDSSNPLIHVFS